MKPFSVITNSSTITKNQVKQELLIPNIVSFSGGRTSAMMLLKLLEQGKLQPWRGDCVVFNNTSAEHAATYGFVSRIKQPTFNPRTKNRFIAFRCDEVL